MIQEQVSLSAVRFRRWPVLSAILLAAAQMVHAQSILGHNLIANGDAEAGPASPDGKASVASIPNWTRGTGNANVFPYDLTGFVLLSHPAPPDHLFQYFASTVHNVPSTLTQTIDVSSGASTISGGNVKYTASAYLGIASGSQSSAQAVVAFENANGQKFSSVTLGPSRSSRVGMSLQQQTGLVPSGTVRITVTLTLDAFNGSAAADSLSLVLNTLGTVPGSVLGANLVVNPGGEAGPGVPATKTTLYVPGWSATNSSVAPYGGTDWIAASAPGPADRGVNLFCGPGDSYQDIDVSPAASLVDAGQVKYTVSGWLGSLVGFESPTLTYVFFDWSGKQLATTAQLGPPNHSGTGLVLLSHSDTLPAGTRRVHIALDYPSSGSLADNIGFVISVPGLPVISPGGIVSASAFGAFTSIAPGSWIEIFGTDLAPDTRGWAGADFNNGVAPTSLGGVKVSVGGVPAFIDYISPTQVNALVPSNAPTGAQKVTVSYANGTSDGFGITVNQTQPGLLAPPGFQIGGKQYLAALFPDGTFAIPQDAISGVASRPAKPGDTLIVYGIGFGPVTGGLTAGTLVTQQNSLTAPIQFLFDTTPATLLYQGLAPSFTGLYQFNVVVPNVPANSALPISFSLGGIKGSQTLFLAVQN